MTRFNIPETWNKLIPSIMCFIWYLQSKLQINVILTQRNWFFCHFSHKLLFWKDFTPGPCPDMQFCSIVDVVECEQLAREATEPSNFNDACRNHLINHKERKTKCHNSSRKVACIRQFIFTVFIILRLEGGETPDGLLYLVDWWIN